MFPAFHTFLVPFMALAFYKTASGAMGKGPSLAPRPVWPPAKQPGQVLFRAVLPSFTLVLPPA